MVKLKVITTEKKRTNGKGSFVSYYSPVKIVVKGEETEGAVDKTITVKFRKAVNVADLPKVAIITCKESDVNAPFVYEIKENADGTKEYPVIWIRGIESVAKAKTNAVNTCSFLTDEEDTPETDIA